MAALDAEALKARALRLAKSFSPSQLVIIGLLGVVALVGGARFISWVTAPSYQVLLAGLDAKDAQAVTAKLQADGVPYQLANGGTTVLVPAASADKERIAVTAAGLPAGATSGGWDNFDKQGIGSSSFQQKVAYQRALEATLAGTLGALDGITKAQVHIALPEERIFSDEKQPARASVLLETSGTVSDETVQSVVHLVASAVPDLDPKDVSVTDSSGQLLTGSDGAASAGKRFKEQQAIEVSLAAQATSMLDAVLGPGKAVVRVSATMEDAQSTLDSVTYDPTKGAVTQKDGSEETYTTGSTGTTPGGVLTSPSPLPSPGAAANGNTYKKTQSSQTTSYNQTIRHDVIAPGGVKRLTVAVAVDRNASTAPPAAQITALVANAVGLDATRGDLITVSQPAFPTAAPTPSAAPAPSGPMASASKYGTTGLAVLLLLLVGLGFFKTVRKATVTDLPVPSVTVGSAGGRAIGGARAALPAGTIPGQRGESDLRQLVDDNADEVAALVRGWLTEVGAGDRR